MVFSLEPSIEDDISSQDLQHSTRPSKLPDWQYEHTQGHDYGVKGKLIGPLEHDLVTFAGSRKLHQNYIITFKY